MFVRKYGLYLAWVLACIGTLLSLYFSDIKKLEPCHLCWFQRMALFPMTIILGIATYKGFLGISRYTLPVVLLGLLLSLYQIAIQEIPGWNPIEICGAGPNCAEKHFIGLGPITIPMLAAVGFFGIAFFLTLAWIEDRKGVQQVLKSERV